jgi:hypothetical protein
VSTTVSKLLSADQCVKEVADDEHRDDQAEEVGAAHVRNEEAERRRRAHTRSMPSMMSSRIANITIPRTM